MIDPTQVVPYLHQVSSKLLPYLPGEVTAQSGVLTIIWWISLAVALFYVWREGYILEFIVYWLHLLFWGMVAIVTILPFALFALVFPPLLLLLIGVGVFIISRYRAQLTGNWPIALIWTIAVAIGSIIGPVVDAWFYVHYAPGEY